MNPFQALKALSLAGAGVALVSPLSAQLSEPGTPASTWADLSSSVPTEMLEAPDIEALLAEDELTGPFPLRYGDVITTSLGVTDSGTWEQVEADGSLVWRMRIEAPGAYTLGVVFSEYEIPAGGQVFLYTDDMSEILGAYTDSNNNVNGLLGIQPIVGDAVTVEYVQQAWAEGAPKLRVGEVIYDYKNVRNLLEVEGSSGSSGADGGCGLIGVNCPEGAPYQTIKRSVMRTLSGGSLCSASLLNNTGDDGTPYMLTANHCGGMTSGQFLFKYEQSTCGTFSGPQSSVISGAQLLASSGTYDSQLYRLNTDPPASFDVHWAGWDRANGTNGPAVTIGHGGGGPKNIAIDNSGASFSGSDWQVFWNQGYIIGGNSGGPLFNGLDRVIGPACCVNTFTCGSQTAWYGRLDLFWNSFNLGQWLDPTGSGILSLDGTDNPGSGGGGTLAITSISPSTIDALNVGTDQIVTITGTGFQPTTTVEVDGSALFGIPSPYTYVNSTTITFDPPEPSALGLSIVTVKNGATSAIGLLTYEANDTPALQAGNGEEPVTLFSAGGMPLKCAGTPGDLFVVLGSTSNVPTSVPGFFSIGIGNNFTNLFNLVSVTIPADGVEDINVPLGGLPPFTTFYIEGVAVDAGFSLPLPDSNTQEVQVLF
ncbi:MAG: hypothetical protein AAF682_01280 [Planctomycetota bacterium]